MRIFIARGAASLIGIVLLLLGCSLPNLPVSTRPLADAVPPPANLDDELTATRQAVASSNPAGNLNLASGGLDGSYRGSGRVIRNPGGTCQLGMPVYGMKVSGDQVHFGSFSGTIQANGSVEMVSRRNWVIGRFNGPHFEGRWIAPACSYELSLDRESGT